MNSITDFIKKGLRFFLCITVSAVIFVACDTLQKDTVQDKDQVTVTNNEVYITPTSSGIIDLGSMVESYGPIKISVTGQPALGKLDQFESDLLQYTPGTNVSAGKDGFAISVYTSTNEFIKHDSVRIIIKKDSTDLPCKLLARNDFVYNVHAPVEIDVLQNDILCPAERSKIEISIIQSGTGVHPEHGTAVVLSSKKIRYSPNNFSTRDHFTYRITKPENVPNQGDKRQVSYGIVYLYATTSCKDSLKVNSDHYRFNTNAINHADTIRINPTANDVICRRSNDIFQMTISRQPAGKVFLTPLPPYNFKYLLPAGAVAGFRDSFKYNICVDNVCKETEVSIELYN